MKTFLTKAFLLLALLLSDSILSKASHIMGGGITYHWTGTGQNYEITVKFYRDCSGIPAPTTIDIEASSITCAQSFTSTAGIFSQHEITPACPATLTTCNGGSAMGMEEVIYKVTITLPGTCSDWVFSRTECCRNASITTLANPGALSSYYFATLDNLNYPFNNSVEFASDPVVFPSLNNTVHINNGAFDLDGDSISITLAPALEGPALPVTYNFGYTYLNPISSSTPIVLDPLTGDLTLTPSAMEVGVVVYKAEEYRNGILIGTVTRDIQVIVTSASNNLPAILSPSVVTVCAGNTLNASYLAMDTDPGDSTFFVSYSFDAPASSYTFTYNQNQLGSLNLDFTSDPTMISSQPYLLHMKIRDNACPYYGIQQYTFRIYVTNCGIDVWPGDADADLTCDLYDVLPIGLAFGSTGPVRSGASNSWTAQPGTPWGSTFLSGLDYMHADCNGDGTVDWNDTTAISLNFGQTHPLRNIQPGYDILSIAPIKLVASVDSVGPTDTFAVEVRLGNSVTPVDELYGIAFRIHFNAALVDSNLSFYSFVNSWLGTPGSDLLTFSKPNWTDGFVDVVSVRNNQVDVSGDSTIGILEVVVIDNVSARALNHFMVTGIRGITSQGESIYFEHTGDTVIVDPSPTGLDESAAHSFILFPNPVSDILTVSGLTVSGIQMAEIFNALGEKMNVVPVSTSRHLSIDVSAFPSGMYVLKLETGKRTEQKVFSVH